MSKEVIGIILGHFVDVMGKVQNKVLLGKIKNNVFDMILELGNELLEVKKCRGDIDSGDDTVLLGSIGLCFRFSAKFYELGSAVECPQGNRKVLFGLHEQFMKLEKDFANSGIDDIFLPTVMMWI